MSATQSAVNVNPSSTSTVSTSDQVNVTARVTLIN